MISKKSLAVKLSRLKGFSNPKEFEEQYESDSEIVAEVIWHLSLAGKLPKKVADYGAGPGMLGIACLYMGCHVTFIEKDEDAITDLKQNLKGMPKKYEIVNSSVLSHLNDYELILMNPPFGTRRKGVDIEFLMQAINHSPLILSMHKTTTINYIKKFLKNNNYDILFEWNTEFPIKAKYSHHKKHLERIEVTVVVSEKL